ncbi:MAG: aminoglycoside phosphotransferase family protein [Candidatus Dormibacteraeota bacterium]|uniref:Aminoglycoside phosphotransferase family protein n=1 Tax=Candidatus Amunia macphersoniae TaxID=3127014 RepID=A0A934NJ79_9BACT|nr:aminoglycoside phosphotransferase family protein [Candidatus Dormibacteraeota bacterium]
MHHNPLGHRSLSYTAQQGDQTVIVRINTQPARFASTVKNLEVLRELGILVPKVLAEDLSCSHHPFAYMILRAIPGTDLRFALPTMSNQEQRLVAAQVMDFERRVCKLPEGQGYGYAGVGETPPHRSWREAIAFGAFSQGYAPDAVDAELMERAMEAVEHLAPYLDSIRPTCFLDDLTTKNVIVDHGALCGVVDFDVVCYGDPLFQIGLTQTAVGFDLPDSCMSYVEHLCTAADVTQDQRRVIHLYAGLCGIDFLSRMAVSPAHAAGVARINRWLDRAV